MDEQIKQIAERLRGLRDVLELTAEDIARECDISPYDYRLAETGDFVMWKPSSTWDRKQKSSG